MWLEGPRSGPGLPVRWLVPAAPGLAHGLLKRRDRGIRPDEDLQAHLEVVDAEPEHLRPDPGRNVQLALILGEGVPRESLRGVRELDRARCAESEWAILSAPIARH